MNLKEIEQSCQQAVERMLPGATVSLRTIIVVTVAYDGEEIEVESRAPELDAQRIAQEFRRIQERG